MELLVVIVNYRTAGMVVDCLRTLADEGSGVGLGVVVVDNQSGDGSVARIEAAAAELAGRLDVCVLAAERNGGFAFGNNAGVQAWESEAGRGGRGPSEFVLYLNPDTLVRPGALGELVGFMRGRPRCGVAGCSHEDAGGRPQRAAHAMLSPWRELARGSALGALWRRMGMEEPSSQAPYRCDWVSGAALCVRRAALDQVRGMDEGFFLYFEEVDFCKRVLDAGWEVWHVPASRIVHLEGSATGIGDRARRKPRYWFESRRRFFAKHYGSAGVILADALWVGGRFTLWLRRGLGLAKGGEASPPHFVRDLVWGDLRAVLSGRTARIRSGQS